MAFAFPRFLSLLRSDTPRPISTHSDPQSSLGSFGNSRREVGQRLAFSRRFACVPSFCMSSSNADWQACTLCGREVPKSLITLHHLTPKQRGGKSEHRTAMCKPCHKQLHA